LDFRGGKKSLHFLIKKKEAFECPNRKGRRQKGRRGLDYFINRFGDLASLCDKGGKEGRDLLLLEP